MKKSRTKIITKCGTKIMTKKVGQKSITLPKVNQRISRDLQRKYGKE